MRQKLDGVRKNVCHKTRYLIYRCITHKLEYQLKLYSRELCSTIDPLQNTKTESIYSENLPNSGVLSHLRLGVLSVEFKQISFVRRHLNCAWLL